MGDGRSFGTSIMLYLHCTCAFGRLPSFFLCLFFRNVMNRDCQAAVGRHHLSVNPFRIESTGTDEVNRKWRDNGSMTRSIRLLKKGVPAVLDSPQPPEPPSVHLTVTVTKGGPPATMRIPYVVTSPRRLGCHAEVPDRRGVARQTPAPPKAAGAGMVTAGTGPVAKAIGRVDRSPHARRAGESRYGRSGRR